MYSEQILALGNNIRETFGKKSNPVIYFCALLLELCIHSQEYGIPKEKVMDDIKKFWLEIEKEIGEET